MYTISRDYRKEIVIEKSRFICSLKKVHSEAEAQEFIKAVKKEFWDATHNCSAYIVDDLAQRSSDDGEPSGTAGIPMPSPVPPSPMSSLQTATASCVWTLMSPTATVTPSAKTAHSFILSL